MWSGSFLKSIPVHMVPAFWDHKHNRLFGHIAPSQNDQGILVGFFAKDEAKQIGVLRSLGDRISIPTKGARLRAASTGRTTKVIDTKVWIVHGVMSVSSMNRYE